jgi:threonine dehydrogenase-like Zn-dependent dehydrogenase
VAGSFIDRFTFLPAIQMIAEKKVDAKSLITSTFPLAEAKKAFDLMEQGKGIKIQLKP